MTTHSHKHWTDKGGRVTRTTRHEGYTQSINTRRGTEKVSAVFRLHVIAYNLIRLGDLLNPEMAAA